MVPCSPWQPGARHLIYLSGHPGEVISKQKLLDHVWSDVTAKRGACG